MYNCYSLQSCNIYIFLFYFCIIVFRTYIIFHIHIFKYTRIDSYMNRSPLSVKMTTQNLIETMETSIYYIRHTQNIKLDFRTYIFKNPYFQKLDIPSNRKVMFVFMVLLVFTYISNICCLGVTRRYHVVNASFLHFVG